MNVEAKYLRMIQGMKRRGRKDWTVYILRCGDGSLYTGIAKDVRARVKQHSEGRGATYTRTRLPVKLLYQKEGLTRSEALVREARIKAMPRSKKEEIIFSEHWSRTRGQVLQLNIFTNTIGGVLIFSVIHKKWPYLKIKGQGMKLKTESERSRQDGHAWLNFSVKS